MKTFVHGPPKPELGDGGQVGNASEDTFNFTYSMVSIKRAEHTMKTFVHRKNVSAFFSYKDFRGLSHLNY